MEAARVARAREKSIQEQRNSAYQLLSRKTFPHPGIPVRMPLGVDLLKPVVVDGTSHRSRGSASEGGQR